MWADMYKGIMGAQPERVMDSERQEILVNKKSHQIRFEREDENQVTIVIQKKQDAAVNAQVGERPATT